MKSALCFCLGAVVALFSNAGCSGKDPVPVLSPTNGAVLDARSGEEIDLLLQTLGSGRYISAEVSSEAVRFIGIEVPKQQNPGGPTQVFKFQAVSPGSATIAILPGNESAMQVFKVTLNVK
jgi:hypothetical protein